MTNELADQIERIRGRVAAAARQSGRAPEAVRIIAVTKTQSPELVWQAWQAGVRDFGENRVQEAEAKMDVLADQRAAMTWHLIGHLQSNKARRAVTLFDCVQSVDSLRLAQALDRHVSETQRQGEWETRRRQEVIGLSEVTSSDSLTPNLPHSSAPPLSVLLQVNVSGEASKDGFALAGWEANRPLLDMFCVEVEQFLVLPHVAVTGLMTIAPFDDPQAAQATFRSTRRLRDELAHRFPQTSWAELSMGMTDDFELAIAEGSTMVRIGRAIFGSRQKDEG